MMFKLPILPPMKCDAGCQDCCGPVLCSQSEFDAVASYAARQGVIPRRQGITCPLFQNGRCSVYEARPWICRLFGHSPKLVCSHGYNTNISAKTERKATYAYTQSVKKEGERFLHELCFTTSEIQAIHEFELARK